MNKKVKLEKLELTDKLKLKIAGNCLKSANTNSRHSDITEQSNANYLSKLEVIYKIESETIFKESGKRERFIRK